MSCIHTLPRNMLVSECIAESFYRNVRLSSDFHGGKKLGVGQRVLVSFYIITIITSRNNTSLRDYSPLFTFR